MQSSIAKVAYSVLSKKGQDLYELTIKTHGLSINKKWKELSNETQQFYIDMALIREQLTCQHDEADLNIPDFEEFSDVNGELKDTYNRLVAELAAKDAELAALRAALAEPDEYTVECNGKKSSVLTAMMNGRAKREAALAETDEPVAYLDEGLGAFYWPKEYEKLPHKDFVPLYTHPPRREPLVWRKC